MPGSIRIADIQPPVTAPLFLQVNVGKKVYSGNIGQDDFSLPVTSIRDSMVMTLYDADKELVSKTEVKTKLIVELGTMDAVFTLGSGGTIILQLKFLLSDEDRKRIQEMRNSVMKRKQQDLLGNGTELYFQDSPLPKEQTEENSDVPSKEDQFTLRKSMSVDDLKDQLTLRKSMSLDDLKERFVFSESSVDPDAAAPKVPTPPQSGGSSSTLEVPVDIGSKKGQGKPGSRSSSAVKKMISAFESSSPQALPSMPRIKSESSLEGMISVAPEASTDPSRKPPTPSPSSNVSGYTQTGLMARTPGKVTMTVPSADAAGVSGKQAMISNKKPNMHESRRRSSRQSAGANDMIRHEKRSVEKRRRRSMSTYPSPEQPQASRSAATSSSITWIGHPHVCITSGSRQLKDIVDLEHLNSMKNAIEETEKGSVDGEARRSHGFPVLNGWLINQGVRGVIVIIACGAVFFNNR